MKALAEQINELDGIEIYGRVVGVRGLMVEVAGPLHAMSVGARVVIETPGKPIPCEVVGFSGGNTLLMPFAPLEGVRADAGRWSPRLPARFAPRPAGRGAWSARSARSASRLTARAPCCLRRLSGCT